MEGIVRVRAVMGGLLLLGVALGGCGQTEESQSSARVGLANPASQNCVDLGGESRIQSLGNGAQYGVCVFEGNRQCEEWALFRGQCPKGGLKITGYVTAGSRYCAITGGQYRATSEADLDHPEKGECRLPDGRSCPASALFAGDCPKGPS
uniref:Hemolysin n=1 Tax=uncultured myxobacterium HF0200_01L06 TaxID=723556 RepID=E7C3J0_9BACT|nr:hypothetical protein [uncultured myxobacterium HF0200_01L06]